MARRGRSGPGPAAPSSGERRALGRAERHSPRAGQGPGRQLNNKSNFVECLYSTKFGLLLQGAQRGRRPPPPKKPKQAAAPAGPQSWRPWALHGPAGGPIALVSHEGALGIAPTEPPCRARGRRAGWWRARRAAAPHGTTFPIVLGIATTQAARRGTRGADSRPEAASRGPTATKKPRTAPGAGARARAGCGLRAGMPRPPPDLLGVSPRSVRSASGRTRSAPGLPLRQRPGGVGAGPHVRGPRPPWR